MLKKLIKKREHIDTIEAYCGACVCGNCGCSCFCWSCNCGVNISYANRSFSLAFNAADDMVGGGQYDRFLGGHSMGSPLSIGNPM